MIESAGFGLSILFIRELGTKGQSEVGRESDEEQKNWWGCFGSFQYVHFRPRILQLSGFDHTSYVAHSDDQRQASSPYEQRGLLCFGIKGLTDPDEVEMFSPEARPQLPLIVVTQIKVSRRALARTPLKALGDAVEHITREFAKAFDRPKTEGQIYGCLGEADFVVVSRTRRLSAVFDVLGALGELTDESGYHRFGAVYSIVGYSQQVLDDQWQEIDRAQSDEESGGFQPVVSFSVDCGHERTVVEKIDEQGVHEFSYPFGRENVRCHTNGFSDLMGIVQRCVHNRGWRFEHLSESRTSLYTKGPLTESAVEHGPLELTEEACKTIQSVKDDMGACTKALPVGLRDALVELAAMFEIGYTNYYLVGCLADIREPWSSAFMLLAGQYQQAEAGSPPAEFMDWVESQVDETRAFVECLQTAVANRTVHNLAWGEQAWVCLPSRDDIAKILMAHSAFTRKVWRRFTKRDFDDSQGLPYACITTLGTGGEIKTREFFRGGREEAKITHPQNYREHWNTNILRIEIPRPHLLKPTASLACLAHELAEATNFPHRDKLPELRAAAIDALVQHAAHLTLNAYLALLPDRGEPTKAEQECAKRHLRELVDFFRFSLHMRSDDDSGAWKRDEVLADIRDIKETGEHLSLVMFFQLRQHSDIMAEFTETEGKQFTCETSVLEQTVTRHGHVLRQDYLATARLIANVVADAGMIMCLGLRREDVDRIFTTRLQEVGAAAMHDASTGSGKAGGDSTTVERSLLMRWAIQALAYGDSQSPHVRPSYEIVRELTDTGVSTEDFRSIQGMIDCLHRHAPYGGEEGEEQFPPLDEKVKSMVAPDSSESTDGTANSEVFSREVNYILSLWAESFEEAIHRCQPKENRDGE